MLVRILALNSDKTAVIGNRKRGLMMFMLKGISDEALKRTWENHKTLFPQYHKRYVHFPLRRRDTQGKHIHINSTQRRTITQEHQTPFTSKQNQLKYNEPWSGPLPWLWTPLPHDYDSQIAAGSEPPILCCKLTTKHNIHWDSHVGSPKGKGATVVSISLTGDSRRNEQWTNCPLLSGLIVLIF